MARSCRLALFAAAGSVGVARAALRGAVASGSSSSAAPNATQANRTARVGFTPGASSCDCRSGCSDRHCSAVNDVFGMIYWDREGADCKTSDSGCTGGALLHMIGSPENVDDLLGPEGRIDWLSGDSKSFGDPPLYQVLNDCRYNGDEAKAPCSAAALLRSDVLPTVFNYPDTTGAGRAGNVHPIGLLFDPWLLQDGSYGIKGMFVLDGDTVEFPIDCDNCIPAPALHPPCTMESGWNWASDYNAAGSTFNTGDIGSAMNGQCYFALEAEKNWAGFWGNFIDARKAFQREIRDGDTSSLPDTSSYLEPEIDIDIVDPAAWENMYSKALKAVVVQTNYCSEQLSGSAVDQYCKDADENSVIRLGKLGACRVALQIKQDTGNDLPVLEANLLTNSMYNREAWEQFRSGDDYIANPEDYMQYYDCCWLLNDLMENDEDTYKSLLAVGWYDNQCCWEQDAADKGWKNCDYCTDCKP